MEEYKRKYEDLKEMANLPSKDTGFSKGFLYISTQEGNHGARVKYYRNSPSQSRPYASISINKIPRLLVDDIKITSKEFKEVSDFIKLNLKDLLKFWNEGAYLMKDEQQKLVNSLKTI